MLSKPEDIRYLEGRVFKLNIPIRANTAKNKKEALNLNIYRNLHHYSLAYQKKSFHAAVSPLLKGLPHMNKISLHYEICPKTKRRMDIMNIGSIVDKYFSDSLVEEKIIPDDDYNHVKHISFSFGGIVLTENVLVTITELLIEKESKPMRILLDEFEIQEALNDFVQSKNIMGACGVELSVDKDGKVTAEVKMESENKELKSKTTKSKGRPKAVPKEEEQDDTMESASSSSDTGNSSGSNNTEEDTNNEVDESKTSKTKKWLFFDSNSYNCGYY